MARLKKHERLKQCGTYKYHEMKNEDVNSLDIHPPTEPVDPFPSPQLCPTDAAGQLTNGARFGCSRNGGSRWHGGIDLRANVGTPLKAIYSGKVTRVRNRPEGSQGYDQGVGNFIIIRSANFSIKYCHLSTISVEENQQIAAGQIIGATGRSGNAYSVPHKHLHLELSTDHFDTMSSYVDPEPFLKTKYGINPNNPNPANCPAFLEEDLDFFRVEDNKLS